MKRFVETILAVLARAILKKYNPKVIAITGSVGKTSTKEAIFSVVKARFNTRASFKNYNNEIGVPLTIIGKESPGKSTTAWLSLFIYALKLLILRDKKYPDILVLEIGADRPGDIEHLRRIIQPDIVVITSIASVHLEAFVDIEGVLNEKLKLAQGLAPTTPIFINGDNTILRNEMKTNTKLHYVSYGFGDNTVKAYGEKLITDKKNRYRVLGMECSIQLEEDTGVAFLPGVISKSHIFSALAAVGVARALGIPFNEILERLKTYHLPAGRMRLLPGIKQTLIIDDTYNSSPDAVHAAFESIVRLPVQKHAKRWAVLGDMLELGRDSTKLHKTIGQDVVEHEFNYLVTVGALAKDIARGAKTAGMDKDQIFSFDNPLVAGTFLEDRINKNDIIFVKGSQGARMEKVVKEILGDPMRANEMLVRQDASWRGR